MPTECNRRQKPPRGPFVDIYCHLFHHTVAFRGFSGWHCLEICAFLDVPFEELKSRWLKQGTNDCFCRSATTSIGASSQVHEAQFLITSSMMLVGIMDDWSHRSRAQPGWHRRVVSFSTNLLPQGDCIACWHLKQNCNGYLGRWYLSTSISTSAARHISEVPAEVPYLVKIEELLQRC